MKWSHNSTLRGHTNNCYEPGKLIPANINNFRLPQTSESALANFSSKDLEISLGAVEDFLNKLLLKVSLETMFIATTITIILFFKAPLPVPALEAMDKIYRLSEKQNSEIKFRLEERADRGGGGGI